MICPNWLKNRMTKTPDKKVKKHCIIQLSGEKKDNINYTTVLRACGDDQFFNAE